MNDIQQTDHKIREYRDAIELTMFLITPTHLFPQSLWTLTWSLYRLLHENGTFALCTRLESTAWSWRWFFRDDPTGDTHLCV